jgi:hypothetical protein
VEHHRGTVCFALMKLACLLCASTLLFTAIDGAMAQDSNKKEEDRVPPTEQKEDPRKQTEPTGAEKSVRPGGELDESTRKRTRDDVIRDTLRDRGPK